MSRFSHLLAYFIHWHLKTSSINGPLAYNVKGEASKFLVERIKEETLLHGDSLVSEGLVLNFDYAQVFS